MNQSRTDAANIISRDRPPVRHDSRHRFTHELRLFWAVAHPIAKRTRTRVAAPGVRIAAPRDSSRLHVEQVHFGNLPRAVDLRCIGISRIKKTGRTWSEFVDSLFPAQSYGVLPGT